MGVKLEPIGTCDICACRISDTGIAKHRYQLDDPKVKVIVEVKAYVKQKKDSDVREALCTRCAVATLKRIINKIEDNSVGEI